MPCYRLKKKKKKHEPGSSCVCVVASQSATLEETWAWSPHVCCPDSLHVVISLTTACLSTVPAASAHASHPTNRVVLPACLLSLDCGPEMSHIYPTAFGAPSHSALGSVLLGPCLDAETLIRDTQPHGELYPADTFP